MNENELSVTKYLEAITVMSNSIGKLDSLRVHLKENNDNRYEQKVPEIEYPFKVWF